MDSEQDFEALVRRSGTVFTTNVGQGSEEMVLAIATPTLKKTQVATQADLVAAGYVRVEGLQRVEAECGRLEALLLEAQQHHATVHQESAARQKQLLEENRALERRVQELETLRAAEQAGIAARSEGAHASTNPYLGGDEAPRLAWNHGWKLRNVLLTQDERLQAQADELRVLDERRRLLERQVEGLARDKAALQAHVQAVLAEKQAQAVELQAVDAARQDLEAKLRTMGQQATRHGEAARIVRDEVGRLEAEHTALLERYTMQSGRLQKIQAAYQRLLLEAPHSGSCAREQGATCDCWLFKFGYAAIEQPR